MKDVCVLIRVRLFVASWTVGFQAPLSMKFSRQEYLSRVPFSTPGDLPDPGIKPASLESPASAGGLFTTSATWEAQIGFVLMGLIGKTGLGLSPVCITGL